MLNDDDVTHEHDYVHRRELSKMIEDDELIHRIYELHCYPFPHKLAFGDEH